MRSDIRRDPIAYIGSFPPPHGGVTVKNALLFKWMSRRVPMKLVNLTALKAFKLETFAAFVQAMLSRRGSLVIGMSNGWCRRTTDFLYLTNRQKMGRSVLFVMGGALPGDTRYARRLGTYRQVYVETDDMRRGFEDSGASNIAVYPNCRERPDKPLTKEPLGDRPLRCVFFSLIAEIKGAGIVLSAASKLPEIEFHFYGHVDPAFENQFRASDSALANVFYHGVFDSEGGNAAAELSKYDLHVFPTMWPNEGVPGVIVETKIAGVPTIATDRCHNAELIEDGTDGWLLSDATAQALVRQLSILNEHRSMLETMHGDVLHSAERYYIDQHIDTLVSGFQGRMRLEGD